MRAVAVPERPTPASLPLRPEFPPLIEKPVERRVLGHLHTFESIQPPMTIMHQGAKALAVFLKNLDFSGDKLFPLRVSLDHPQIIGAGTTAIVVHLGIFKDPKTQIPYSLVGKLLEFKLSDSKDVAHVTGSCPMESFSEKAQKRYLRRTMDVLRDLRISGEVPEHFDDKVPFHREYESKMTFKISSKKQFKRTVFFTFVQICGDLAGSMKCMS